MPNKKSAEKALRQSAKKNAINKKVSSTMKKLVKDTLSSVKENNAKTKEDFKKTVKAIDKAAKKGLIKKNTANRKKSRLQKKVNKIK